MSVEITNLDKIPNAPFREEFRRQQEKMGLSATELGIRLGWNHHKGSDTSRVFYTLGIKKRYSKTREYVTYDLAVSLCEALNLDPIDVGI